MIECQKCGRKFKNYDYLTVLAEVQRDSDDVYVVPAYLVNDELPSNEIKLFRGCPDCLSSDHLREIKSRYKRKYRQGGHILSLDEFMQQDFIYFNGKIQPKAWFQCWQINMVNRCIGINGCIYYAIKNEFDK